MGYQAGFTGQGESAVAIGNMAGQTSQQHHAIAIGNMAGQTSQPANSIVINASGSSVNGDSASACYIAPIRTSASALTQTQYPLYYDTSSKELFNGPFPLIPTILDGSGNNNTIDRRSNGALIPMNLANANDACIINITPSNDPFSFTLVSIATAIGSTAVGAYTGWIKFVCGTSGLTICVQTITNFGAGGRNIYTDVSGEATAVTAVLFNRWRGEYNYFLRRGTTFEVTYQNNFLYIKCISDHSDGPGGAAPMYEIS